MAVKFDTHQWLSGYGIGAVIYGLVVAVLWSPYFTPPATIGPEGGILRADQVLLPLVVGLIVYINFDRVNIPINHLLMGLLAVTITIAVSVTVNAVIYGGPAGISELYDLIIWIGYVGLVVAVGGNLPTETAKRALLLIVLLSGGVAVVAILQSLNVTFAVERIAPIYTAREQRIIVQEPTATTTNPNTLAKLLLPPLFFAFAQSYRHIARDAPLQKERLIGWMALSLLFSASIVVTGSRSGLIATVIGFCVVGAVIALGRIGQRKRRRATILATSLSGIVGIFLIVVVFEVGRLAYLQNPLQDNSLQTRFEIWNTAVPIILEQPLIGHGPSKAVQLDAGIVHIESGFLSWWYHYGVTGIIAFAVVLGGALKIGIEKTIDGTLFEYQPVFWGAAVAVVGWFSGSVAAWTVAGVPQSRRVFTLSLLIVALLISSVSQEHD
ncbi:O-antigen ligase family protein [Halopiger djelfimassiliensis]|uniref:O-antigen ligase family protein n=1 Tax=Halopiger djelfimassiliensis TaxID=1293047 RepID=UPI0006782684|nr:O-antigen ligase family protein [Halopiger djelfimassiliensis]